jgi:hypothetical protein
MCGFQMISGAPSERRHGSRLLLCLAFLTSQAAWAVGPLSVPTNGVYLGIWADPSLGSNSEEAIEVREGPAPLGIGRTFALHLHYYAWTDLSHELVNGVFQPDVGLQGDIGHGRVPVISWACDDTIPNSDHVIAGSDPSEDAVITATAKALAQYPGPVLLRWLWEFNDLGNHQTCRGDTGGTPTPQVYNDFIGAWQHIRTLFRNAGATNVSFLWNASHYTADGNADDPHGFYPGNDYVDWIGVDTYQRNTTATFDGDFGLFYTDFSDSQYGNKPLMVGENGSQNFVQNSSELQWTYLQGLLADVQANRYPLFKGYDYFDAVGTNGSWVLDDNNGHGDGGLAAFATLAASPSFSAIPAGEGSRPIPSVTFYVAPNGNDSWSGHLPAPNAAGTDGPFATFDHARAAVQALNKSGLTQVTVQFRAGTYFLPSTENFTAADSGTAGTEIVYENFPRETPVISGGVRVQDWTNVGGNKWQTTLPASTQYFENLFYNGVRRLRPRLGGYLGTYLRFAGSVYVASQQTNCSVEVNPGQWECFDRFQYNPSDPISDTWKNLAPAAGNLCDQTAGNAAIAGDIEVLDWEQFSTSKLRVSCVDTTNHIVYLTGRTGINQGTPSQDGFIAGNRYLVENVQDELTQPGQWFLDRSKAPWTLTYLANPGENPNTDIVITPQLPQLVIASNLQYVAFRGLTFEHDNYTIPAAGHPSEELEPDISAAVSFQNSQHVTFDSGAVAHTSGAGLEFLSCINSTSPAWCVSDNLNATTANDMIENSAFYDLGALGVRIGDPFVPADTDANVPYSMTVQNNVVEGYGRTIPASFGIGQGVGHDNLYTHNDVYDGYHCAISISMQAGDMTTPSGIGNANNTISFNHVHDLLQGIMNDGGSIRIEAGNEVFTAAGNKILNNRIHDVTDASIMDSNGYGGDGIYLDTKPDWWMSRTIWSIASPETPSTRHRGRLRQTKRTS